MAKTEERTKLASMDAKKAILVVDDAEMNRALLGETFHDTYDIIEAENGQEALEKLDTFEDKIVAILLDLVMPVMNGFDVLEELNRRNTQEDIPVFLITSESDQAYLRRGYELGVVDVVSKPFMPDFIRKRIGNVIELYQIRQNLKHVVEEQDLALQRQALQLEAQAKQLQETNSSIIDTLSTVIEFRNCESGEHVKRIRSLTRLILDYMIDAYPKYNLRQDQLQLISDAAVMHDVGKIAIPDAILNKPARLTPEEFEIMKTHSLRGCEILESIPSIHDSPLYQYAYDICRHHHERWDGRGYPDKLQGNEISIWAQVVSLADVYDALVSERVYKASYSHEQAVQMIINGECGAFNPDIMDCFGKMKEQIHTTLYASTT